MRLYAFSPLTIFFHCMFALVSLLVQIKQAYPEWDGPFISNRIAPTMTIEVGFLDTIMNP